MTIRAITEILLDAFQRDVSKFLKEIPKEF
jgi:hypothetical protein